MQGQIDQGRRDNAAYGQLERKYETLSNDMRTLQARRRPLLPALPPPTQRARRRPRVAGHPRGPELMLDCTRVHKEVHEVDAEHAQPSSEQRGAPSRRRGLQPAAVGRVPVAPPPPPPPPPPAPTPPTPTPPRAPGPSPPPHSSRAPRAGAGSGAAAPRSPRGDVRRLERSIPRRGTASSSSTRSIGAGPRTSSRSGRPSSASSRNASRRLRSQQPKLLAPFLTPLTPKPPPEPPSPIIAGSTAHPASLPSSAPRQAVSRDPNRSRAHALREELRRLSRQRLALSEELDGPQLTLQQQKDALLQRVKADNGEIADAERRVAEAQDSVRRGRGQLSQLDVDLNEANNPKTQKYQVGRVPMILVGAPRRPPKAPRPARSARAGALSARQGDVRAHRLVRPPEGGGATKQAAQKEIEALQTLRASSSTWRTLLALTRTGSRR